MEKYNSKNASYPQEETMIYADSDAPELVGKVQYPHIIFNNEDGKCGMKVSLEEIVEVWLETLEPERQQTLELEQKTRSDMRELATLRKEKERREQDDKRKQVHNMMKPFLAYQLLGVLSNRGLEITKTNIRNLIGECREKSWYHSTKYQYNPMGILFTEKEWDEFKEDCNKIIMNGNPKNWVGIFDDYEDAVKHSITQELTKLRDAPISFWK
mgnify:CR=1 FL=1|jgi:hypothetical protein